MLNCSHHYCHSCGCHHGLYRCADGCESCNPKRQYPGETDWRWDLRQRHSGWLVEDNRERCDHGIVKADCTACEPLARMRYK